MHWSRGVVFELATQATNVDTQVFGLRMLFCSPDASEQSLVGENLARMQGQFLEQFKFCRRKSDQYAIFPDPPLLEVDFHVAKTLRADRDGLVRPVVTPQHSFDTSQQLSYAEGLGQIVVGPLVQCGDFVSFFAKRSENDDRHSASLANSPANLQPIHARHHDIQDN